MDIDFLLAITNGYSISNANFGYLIDLICKYCVISKTLSKNNTVFCDCYSILKISWDYKSCA